LFYNPFKGGFAWMPLTRKSITTELAVKVIAENKATQQKLAKELRAREAVIACC